MLKETKIYPLLDWIIHNQVDFNELKVAATQLKESVCDNEKAIAEIVSAMNQIDGYNYGGSWASHWYECPNGHPYFIGDCGGAMEVAKCIECGEDVGGSSHALLQTNRQVEGTVRRVIDGRTS
eukprot:12500265-Ditylum_brightwellii.AAC.3